jgi:NAD(P)-dependent dehydrogenase (short-subunit alcohol dehydrogenase family)
MWKGEFDLNDRNVVITGGATGIGFALAKALGHRGCRVLLAEPNEDRLKTSVKILRELDIDAHCKVCDVINLRQVETLADYAWDVLGRVDMVFNNAGIGIPQAKIDDTSMDDLHAVFDVNFFGVWHGCRVFAPRLIAQGTPAGIYNTGSENSMFNAVPDFAAYIASKHAVLGLTDNLREQMPDFIHVGLIIPGFVKSGLTEDSTATPMDTDKFASLVLRQIGDGQFYIVSHAHNMVHIRERYAEIIRAFETYAPRYEGDEEFDIRTLLANKK